MHVYRYAKYIYSRNVCIFKTCKENVVTNNNENKIVTNKKIKKNYSNGYLHCPSQNARLKKKKFFFLLFQFSLHALVKFFFAFQR